MSYCELKVGCRSNGCGVQEQLSELVVSLKLVAGATVVVCRSS